MSYHFLFDYDGVLTHKVDFAESLSGRYDIDLPAMRGFFGRHLQECLRGQADMLHLMEDYLGQIRWTGDAQSLFNAIYVEQNTHNQGMFDILRTELEGVFPCYIATNQDHHRCQTISHDPFLQPMFLEVFCSSQFGVAKPEVEYFRKIYSYLRKSHPDLQKEDIIFIDDLPQNVESARTFGLTGHWFKGNGHFRNFLEEIRARKGATSLMGDDISLVPMKLSHARGYSDILSEKGTYHFLTEAGPVDHQTAIEKIKSNRRAAFSGTSAYWSVIRKTEFLGFIAVHGLSSDEVAISYGIHPKHRRKGIATQSLKTVLEWNGLQGKKVNLATHTDNPASYQMLSKMGLSYQGIQQTPFGERHVFAKKQHFH